LCCRPENRRVGSGLEVSLDRPDNEEVHGDVTLISLALEFLVEALREPHCSSDPILCACSARHEPTVIPRRRAVVDAAGFWAQGRALLTSVAT